MYALVDTNIILDLLTKNALWCDRSRQVLEDNDDFILSINPIIFGELSAGFERIESLNKAVTIFHRLPLDYDSAFLAEKAYLRYKQLGGTKHRPLPDFFIGAQAAIMGIPLITRDDHRYRHYFPSLRIISPL